MHFSRSLLHVCTGFSVVIPLLLFFNVELPPIVLNLSGFAKSTHNRCVERHAKLSVVFIHLLFPVRSQLHVPPHDVFSLEPLATTNRRLVASEGKFLVLFGVLWHPIKLAFVPLVHNEFYDVIGACLGHVVSQAKE